MSNRDECWMMRVCNGSSEMHTCEASLSRQKINCKGVLCNNFRGKSARERIEDEERTHKVSLCKNALVILLQHAHAQPASWTAQSIIHGTTRKLPLVSQELCIASAPNHFGRARLPSTRPLPQLTEEIVEAYSIAYSGDHACIITR